MPYEQTSPKEKQMSKHYSLKSMRWNLSENTSKHYWQASAGKSYFSSTQTAPAVAYQNNTINWSICICPGKWLFYRAKPRLQKKNWLVKSRCGESQQPNRLQVSTLDITKHCWHNISIHTFQMTMRPKRMASPKFNCGMNSTECNKQCSDSTSCSSTMHSATRGYSYAWWKTVVHITFFKKPNNIWLHQTHVIHINEADYNFMLGLKWWHALYKAEARKQLNKGQFEWILSWVRVIWTPGQAGRARDLCRSC